VLSQAAFSPCRRYRWWLERRWDPAGPVLLFIGLNPSLATAQRDDPTLRRLQGFARRWGYGGLEVLNLFARIASSPSGLRHSADPIGRENDRWLQTRLQALSDRPGSGLWLGWGNGGRWRHRDAEVLELIAAQAAPDALPLWVIGLTASGQPRHPLYAPGAAPLQRLEHPGG
jgi:hypothetical protein